MCPGRVPFGGNHETENIGGSSMPPPPPMSTHDGRVGKLSRRLKSALNHLQHRAELNILEDLLQNFSWSRNMKDYLVKVFELVPEAEWTKKTSVEPRAITIVGEAASAKVHAETENGRSSQKRTRE